MNPQLDSEYDLCGQKKKASLIITFKD
jgi:hypothetical protein